MPKAFIKDDTISFTDEALKLLRRKNYIEIRYDDKLNGLLISTHSSNKRNYQEFIGNTFELIGFPNIELDVRLLKLGVAFAPLYNRREK